MIKRKQAHTTFETLPIELPERKQSSRDYKTIKVSELISSPLERYLRFKYGIVDKVDWSNIKALFGSIFHRGLEYLDKSRGQEKKLYYNFQGWTIVGEYDYFKDGLLIDYKTTSKKAFELLDKKDFADYFWQLQVYRWLLYKVKGEVAERLMNIFFILDTYEVMEIEYEVLEYDLIEEKVKFWLDRHDRIENCTDEEKWKRIEHEFVVDDEEVRLMEKVRYLKCEKFCSVANVCPMNVGYTHRIEGIM